MILVVMSWWGDTGWFDTACANIDCQKVGYHGLQPSVFSHEDQVSLSGMKLVIYQGQSGAPVIDPCLYPTVTRSMVKAYLRNKESLLPSRCFCCKLKVTVDGWQFLATGQNELVLDTGAALSSNPSFDLGVGGMTSSH